LATRSDLFPKYTTRGCQQSLFRESLSGERVVNIDRLQFDEDGKLKIEGPTRSPQPMPSGCQ